MRAAAQAAAEAALREARERNSAGPHQIHESPDFPIASLPQTEGHGHFQQAAEFGLAEQADPQDIFREMMGYQMSEEEQSLLQILAEQQEHQQHLAAVAAIACRPRHQHLTIAQNGVILGATETATGFPPNNLLLTSAYDGVYDEDLPGYLAVKTHFWDKGISSVEAYIRRRTLEGDWIWLSSRVLRYISQPVAGLVLEEARVFDEVHAAKMNRITRITALVVQAIEAARLTTGSSTAGNHGSQEVPMSVDVLDYQTFLDQISRQANGGGPLNEDALSSSLVQEMADAESTRQESFDPLAVLKAVKSGICLDLGMIRLSPAEVKMVTLALTGSLSIEELCLLVFNAMRSPNQDLGAAIAPYMTEFELNEASNHLPQHVPSDQKKPPSRRLRKGVSPRTAPRAAHLEDVPSLQLTGALNKYPPACIAVINLSYTYMGDIGIETISELLYIDNSPLRTVDVSFCGINERGILAFARGLTKRKRKGIPSLQGLILSGNYISYKAAKELGVALSPSGERPNGRRPRKKLDSRKSRITGYDEDNESDELDEDEADDGEIFGSPSRFRLASSTSPELSANVSNERGLQVLHVGSASLNSDGLYKLLCGLGENCPIRELSIHSNNIGSSGANLFVNFLEGKGNAKEHTVMPNLDRLDLSNNRLGNDGTAKLTRAISKRSKVHLVDLRLSCNDIGQGGVETIMNKLIQQNLVSLSLDNNSIGDQGCQLVAASLQSMHQLSRLNLSFNKIGSRGVNSLMRTLVGCESITYLGLSGNTMKISGAIAMGFTLAQHPRLAELDLDNCCLSQAAQCHIVAGIISNRWVPLKRLNGFEAGPPMVAIGALDIYAHSLSNEECFRIRRDEQMKTILQWMESNRSGRLNGHGALEGNVMNSDEQYLTPEFVSNINDVNGAPSQDACSRMLGWLSKIPFDEDELDSLRGYFYDSDGGDGDRGSDGYINLKLRGDLLAALDSGVADEIRDIVPGFEEYFNGSIGLDLDTLGDTRTPTTWATIRGLNPDKMPQNGVGGSECRTDSPQAASTSSPDTASDLPLRSVPDFSDTDFMILPKKRRIYSCNMQTLNTTDEAASMDDTPDLSTSNSMPAKNSASTSSRQSLSRSESDHSLLSHSERRSSNALKPRITLFPEYEVKLEELKAAATEMMEIEDDPAQQSIILTQYAEASLTILRLLRYHCMNSGLDGWRQGGLRRKKVLIIDDSKVTRKMVSRAFEKANFIVDTAENGMEGVQKLKESIYDIAFMDIDMPVMNGFDATKALRRWEDAMRPGARQPICALTAAYVDDFERSELMKFKEAGLDVMESKPCNIPRLFKVVDDVSPMFSDLSISVTQRETASSS